MTTVSPASSSVGRRLAALGMILLVFAGIAYAATLRGRIVRVYPNGVGPAPGIAVTVYNPAFGRSAPAYTDLNGMYYLALPANAYYLEIWGRPGAPPLVYQIRVNEPYTDIPPITIP
jgi:hypothetical protein